MLCCATMLLPNVPYYQTWMAYGYELGGIALVVLYLSFGFFSLAVYGLIVGVPVLSREERKFRVLRIGITALGCALGLFWGYMKLMESTMSLL